MPSAASFTAREVDLVGQALDALAPFRDDPAPISLRRERMFQVGDKLHPTVMAVYLPHSRTAALFDGAFAGPGSVMPLPSHECLQATLAGGVLDDPGIRQRWCQLLGVAPDRQPTAAIIEARMVVDLLAQPDTRPLALEPLGPDTAFALALAWASCRPVWFKKRRPDLGAFIEKLRLLPGSTLRA